MGAGERGHLRRDTAGGEYAGEKESAGRGVSVDGWDLLLPLSADSDSVTVAVPDGTAVLGDGAYRARVGRVIHDLNGAVLLFSPVSGTDAVPLRVTAPADAAPAEGAVVIFDLSPGKCLCYS